MMPEVYKTIPSTFPTVQSNPQCTLCYGTGYKYQKKGQDWRACEYCLREYGTPLSTFSTYPNLVSNPSLYTVETGVTNPYMTTSTTKPANLPVIKANPDCIICRGQGYEWKSTYWCPCERCIKKFGNFLICRYCVGTGYKLKDGTKCKCLKHHLHPAKNATPTKKEPEGTTTTTTTVVEQYTI